MKGEHHGGRLGRIIAPRDVNEEVPLQLPGLQVANVIARFEFFGLPCRQGEQR